MMRRLLLAGGSGVLLAGPVAAAPTTYFSLNAGVTGGYSSNPYLEQDSRGGSASASLSLSPTLTILESESTTVLQGGFSYLHYFNDFGHSRSLSASVSRSQTFSSSLTGNLALSAGDSTSALLNPFLVGLPVVTGAGGTDTTGTTPTTGTATPVVPGNPATGGLPNLPTDIIASRQRVRNYTAQGGLDWKVDALDSVNGTANITRSEYPGGNFGGIPANERLSGFTTYGGTLGYLRTLSPTTSGGFGVTANETQSGLYPDARSIEPTVNMNRRLNEHWTAAGSLGLIFNHQDAGLGVVKADNSTSLGFSASLCGAYTLTSVCFNGGRQSTGSGYGGLRIRTSVSANGSYQLDERSAINGTIGWAHDGAGANQGVGGVSNLTLIQGDIGYSRQLTQRLSLTASLGYQRQRYTTFGNASSISASAGVSYFFGRSR